MLCGKESGIEQMEADNAMTQHRHSERGAISQRWLAIAITVLTLPTILRRCTRILNRNWMMSKESMHPANLQFAALLLASIFLYVDVTAKRAAGAACASAVLLAVHCLSSVACPTLRSLACGNSANGSEQRPRRTRGDRAMQQSKGGESTAQP